MTAISLAADLNPDQRRAVEHGGDDGFPPLLIIAGAGSGKTNTLAHRVAHLIAHGADPRRMMLLTFSRRAATEMRRRVERIGAAVLGAQARPMAEALSWAGTFHAIGARVLREYAAQIGLEPNFSIHDREDSADLMNLVRHELGFSKTERRFPLKGTCLGIYSRAVNAETELAALLESAFPWCAEWEPELRKLFAAYVEAKQRQNVLDYDDLLLCWAMMMAEPAIADHLGERFDHVLVDEYQDTNRLQARILLSLKPTGRGLTVVGDDAQSIYSFRAATVRNILDFPGQFRPKATVVTLERNYRSTQAVLAAANAVIALASERYSKNLWSDRTSGERPQIVNVADDPAQVSYIVDKILENRETGIALKAQAVLFRTSSHSGGLEVELTRRNIPFVKFGGLKFLEAAHVKDVFAFLHWAQNPRDRVAGFRVLQLLPGIGPGIAGKLLDAVDASPRALTALTDMPVPARSEGWDALVAVITDLAASRDWPAAFTRARSWYEPVLEEAHEDAAVRLLDLLQLEQIASGYPSRERFLTELTLDPPEASSDLSGAGPKDEDYLILSTIHSAKGQEWRSVHVLNVVDGCIPSDLGTGSTHELEEERRLLYVAMTRARDQLHLVMPQRFFVTQQTRHGDRHLYAQRTRFITRSMLPLYDDILWPPLKPLAMSQPDATPRIDLKASMRGMWAK